MVNAMLDETEVPASMVVSALDKLIQNPLIFRVYDEDGSPRGVAFNLKEKQFNRKVEINSAMRKLATELKELTR